MSIFSKLFFCSSKKNEWAVLDEISTYKKTDESVFHDKLLSIVDNVSKNLECISKSEIEKASVKIGNYFVQHLQAGANSNNLDQEATEILHKCIKKNIFFKNAFFKFLRQQPNNDTLSKYKWLFAS